MTGDNRQRCKERLTKLKKVKPVETRMKPWQGWTVCYATYAVIAYVVSDNWVGRTFAFLVMAGGITIWAKRQIAKQKPEKGE